MADKSEEVIEEVKIDPNLNIEDLGDGYFRLTAPNGVRRIATQRVYSEVVTKEKYINQYEAV